MNIVDRVFCQDDAGTGFEVLILEKTISIPLLDGTERVPGSRDAKLSTGEWVNITDNPDVFTLKDGRILRRAAPKSNR